jgi:predicted membrane-bound spermidine synthase
MIELNRGSLRDSRVSVICGDALETTEAMPAESFDGAILDLTDPDHPGINTEEYVRILERAIRLLRQDGGIAIHAGSPFLHEGWPSLVSAFVTATPGRLMLSYMVEVPSFGCWSFLCASARMPSLDAIGFPAIALQPAKP